MPTYIDAEKIELMGRTFEHPDTHNVYILLSDVRQSVRQTPAEDVVKVTRCKDCAYYQDNNGGYISPDCPVYHLDVDHPDSFCSWGKPISLDDDIKIYDPKVHSINTDLADRKNRDE